MWYFNNPVRQGPLQQRNRAYKSKAAPEVQKLIVAEQRSNLGLVAPSAQRGHGQAWACPPPALSHSSCQERLRCPSLPPPSATLSLPVSSLSQQTLLQRTGENTLPPRTTLQPLSSSVLLLAGGPWPGGHMNLILKREVYFSAFHALWPSYQGPAAQDSRSGS